MELGFNNAQQVLIHLSEKLSPKQDLLSVVEKKTVEHNLLKLIAFNLKELIKSEQFKYIVGIMQEKTKQHACESVLKLALYCIDTQKLQAIYFDLKKANQALLDYYKTYSLPISSSGEIEKVLGYLLCLNLNRCTYMELSYYSLKTTNCLKIFAKIERYIKQYIYFITINCEAKLNPTSSSVRRAILYYSGLLETPLQRDPEEMERYNVQMASAQADKNKLLQDITDRERVTVIDIGPAGGAVFKSVVSIASFTHGKDIEYCGIEYDQNELETLNEMLNNYRREHLVEFLKWCSFIHGNAFNLSSVLTAIKNSHVQTSDHFLSIILSSVLHEIYSYCPNTTSFY
jgi:hypothetical protein